MEVQTLLLIADDDAEGRYVLDTYLRHYGFATAVANDGAEALLTAQLDRPDVILMDLNMPNMTGWEAIAHLKGDPSTAGIPVVAITGEDQLAREDLVAAGFCAVFRKPYRLARLPQAIQECVKQTSGGRKWVTFDNAA